MRRLSNPAPAPSPDAAPSVTTCLLCDFLACSTFAAGKPTLAAFGSPWMDLFFWPGFEPRLS